MHSKPSRVLAYYFALVWHCASSSHRNSRVPPHTSVRASSTDRNGCRGGLELYFIISSSRSSTAAQPCRSSLSRFLASERFRRTICSRSLEKVLNASEVAVLFVVRDEVHSEKSEQLHRTHTVDCVDQ